jgi:1-acyl-sn-glycerol-3-phosphate acyltransferase
MSLWRRLARSLFCWLSRFLIYLWTIPEVNGLEYLPKVGPALIVGNHLGDADVILGLAYATRSIDPVVKVELRSIPIVGWLLEIYGVIWIHRGQPDRRAIRAVLQGLAEGRVIAIAPEGRESLTGSLEEGTEGAAYIALKSEADLIPVTFTGTENKRIFQNIRRFKRTDVSLTIGKPFRIHSFLNQRQAIAQGTKTIMQVLASQLPMAYRGYYETERLGNEHQ